MKRNYIKGTKFYGNEVSEYGFIRRGLSYKTLVKTFNVVPCSRIFDLVLNSTINWVLVNGSDYDEENDCKEEIYRYCIIDYKAYDFLSYYTDEIIYYCDELDMYVWAETNFEEALGYIQEWLSMD